jgi:hypothetical protein
MVKKKELPHLKVFVDWGASRTKVIYELDGKYLAFHMLPHVTELEPGEKDATDVNEPENGAWVGISDRNFAVGFLAKNNRAMFRFKPLKVESVIPKTLAIVWIGAQKLKLPKKFRVSVNGLLPPSEYKHKEKLRERLGIALNGFNTPSGKYRVLLEDSEFIPEGGGLWLDLVEREPEAIDEVVIIMSIGFRNLSFFTKEHGVTTERQGSDWGFSQVVLGVQEKTDSGYDFASLATALAKTKADFQDLRFLRQVLRSDDADDREEELSRLISVYKAEALSFGRNSREWLAEKLPRHLDKVIIAGGTLDFINDFGLWSKFWSKYLPESNFRGEPVGLVQVSVNDLPEEVVCGIGSRMADIWKFYNSRRNLE